MKHCDQCQITIETNHLYCPLCHQVLKGEGDPSVPEVYPETISMTREVLPLTKKIILFSTMVAILTLAGINWATFDGNYWSLIPIGATLYFWAIVRYGVLSRQNIAFKLAFLTTILVIILNLIDMNVGDHIGWALDYVTPFALLACNLAISMIMWIKRMNYRDYLFYLFTILIFSLVPLFLYFFHVSSILWPALTAFATALFMILFLVIFFPKPMRDEIKKRFHL
ncbi:MAG: DUF6320 domain-containing protein [Candidatus Izemoplasmatales bacterium]|nr:DUF6320 domain-containing protein [Candidatus Izemoplasmatales bacterium]